MLRLMDHLPGSLQDGTEVREGYPRTIEEAPGRSGPSSPSALQAGQGNSVETRHSDTGHSETRHGWGSMAVIEVMIDWADIQRYCGAIARESRPQRIVVFGSYASGRPTKDSVLDVMVIMPFSRRSRVRPSLAIRQRISAGFPVDIL